MLRTLIVGLLAVSCIFSLSVSMHRGITTTVDYALEAEAARKAQLWAEHLAADLPDIAQLMATGEPTDEQLVLIEAAEAAGEVFRFKLFDTSASVVFVSDARTRAGLGGHSDTARHVMLTGEPRSELKNGAGRTDRPELYVEVYVPVRNAAGAVVGVVELYVDQTVSSHLFQRASTWLAYGIVAAFAFAFGMPALAYYFKARQEKRTRARVDYLANFDPMTDLLNRASFTEALNRRSAEDDADWRNSAVIYVDVDNFKAINDTFGHNAGDTFLKHVAHCLSVNALDGDVVARLGGDEFIMVAFAQNEQNMVDRVEALRNSVSEPVQVDGRTIMGQISIGVYWEEGSGLSLDERMQKADMALYQAKLDGRNVYRVFSIELERSILAHRAIETAIRTGLREGRFELHFQPLLHQNGKRCAGFEALLRLRDEHGNDIGPAQFIPVAESMGAINELGLWVLDEAVRTAATWPNDMFVSVNLSPKQFEDGRLIDHVKEVLERHDLPASQLELEVTESLLMENTESVGAQLKALRAMGVSIAMDDFGTGYSSLGYLWQFGFDKLKIDRSFISALDQGDDKANEILDTIIMLGHKLDMTVTAEGIETEAQAETLSKLSCDHFQGYLFGRPVPAADVALFLLNHVRDQEAAAVEPDQADEPVQLARRRSA